MELTSILKCVISCFQLSRIILRHLSVFYSFLCIGLSLQLIKINEGKKDIIYSDIASNQFSMAYILGILISIFFLINYIYIRNVCHILYNFCPQHIYCFVSNFSCFDYFLSNHFVVSHIFSLIHFYITKYIFNYF